MEKPNYESLAKAAGDLQKAVSELKERRLALVTSREALQAKKDFIYRQPLAKDDIKDFIFATIEKSAAEYPKLAKWKENFRALAYPSRDARHAEAYEIKTPTICLLDVEQSIGAGEVVARHTFGRDFFSFFNAAVFANGHAGACFFFGDIIKSKIAEHFDEFFPMDWDESMNVGPEIPERYAKIQRIEAEMAAIDAETATIDQHLSSVEASANAARTTVKAP